MDFSALRAIPFVGSWSQLKQNVPGFYGVGLALEKFEESGRFDQVLDLYQNNAFFRTLVYNSMMSLTKSFFKLTAYMQNDPSTVRFGIRSMQNTNAPKILAKAHWTVRIDGK